ncbi:LANO_0B01574g1_1 [Lachancea nothofagi CBS 11611]|uniref:LANO_0B01574g1_1 n=1 Tax=Lachancea nothofagi CBS 11611 TaxID=1266666 RepID=A0A1G4IVH8_9SACH|nr:LANO_0B01574g1_1 [Lachancea nothofagi CBS 11611]
MSTISNEQAFYSTPPTTLQPFASRKLRTYTSNLLKDIHLDGKPIKTNAYDQHHVVATAALRQCTSKPMFYSRGSQPSNCRYRFSRLPYIRGVKRPGSFRPAWLFRTNFPDNQVFPRRARSLAGSSSAGVAAFGTTKSGAQNGCRRNSCIVHAVTLCYGCMR